jgi:dolichol-phosphate mannosyltransferase
VARARVIGDNRRVLAAPNIAASAGPQPEIRALIQERWACPRCRDRRLQVAADSIRCGACGAAFVNERGIPLFLTPWTAPPPRERLDLTVVVLALNERENVRRLIPDIQKTLASAGMRYDLLVMDGGSTDGTGDVAASLGARVHRQTRRGYGGAVAEALQITQSDYVLMMDADLSHPAPFLNELWKAREQSDLVVASRYVPGARFDAPFLRKVLSRILNVVFTRFLVLPIHDVSSGFRLYRTEAFRNIPLQGTNFETLEELLIKAFLEGRTLSEIPFHYAPRQEGRSHVHFVRFAICFLKTLYHMWALRASIAAADYDDRAFDSRIPLQRYWQRARYGIVVRWMRDCPGTLLDVGCGSSRIIQHLKNAVGMDVLVPKLRYLRAKSQSVLQGSVFELPFADQTFEGLVCSQVIEHIEGGPRPFEEMARVLKPGGRLVIGTPDYGRPWWPAIERVYKLVHPNGYADEHITHYTLPSLTKHLEAAGFDVLDHHYILGAELNVLARRRAS